MAEQIDSLMDIAPRFDAVVLDQWGVLHDGTLAYGNAVKTVAAMKSAGIRLAILSNSGKRARPNIDRIASMGFDASNFELLMSSGEALWNDINHGHIQERRLFPIERAEGDAAAWASGLDVAWADGPADADAILLMGLPDDAPDGAFDDVLAVALDRGMPVFCTNPDRASPRAGGKVVVSPGALAHAHADHGGDVRFYGKPHLPVFRSLEQALGLPAERIVMIGDSLEHDIAGATAAGWASVFVRNGLHRAAFSDGATIEDVVVSLAAAESAPLPDFTLAEL